MSDDGKMPEAQPSDHMEGQGDDGREAASANSFNNQRMSQNQPGQNGGKTAFIAKKER